MVKKEAINKEVEQEKKQKHTTLRALIKARGGGVAEDEEIDEVTKEFYLLDNQLRNTKQTKAILKKEFNDVSKRLEKALDPEVVEKANLHLSYLDEMIKGEQLAILKLNEQSKAYMRLDFTQKEVEGERKCVQMESELNRVKLKIDMINVSQQGNLKRSNLMKDRVVRLTEERADLEN